jgi:hypothetical protein
MHDCLCDRDNDPLTFTLLYGNDEDSFVIPTTEPPRISVAAPATPSTLQLDFERRSSYVVVIRAEDPGLLSCNLQLLIRVEDVNEPPVTPGRQLLLVQVRLLCFTEHRIESAMGQANGLR